VKAAVAIAVLLGFAATAVLGATGLSLDSIAGVYKSTVRGKGQDGAYAYESVLEIVKTSRNQAYIRAHLAFDAGHLCGVWGIAAVEGDALVYRPRRNPGDQCALRLKKAGNRLVFDDANDACQMDFCGANAQFDRSGFALSSRTPIRYMKRLLASRQYALAIAERDAKP
jgi:hypothetical protein